MENARPHVVIVGAGFGGLWAAKGLSTSNVTVTIVDRNNYHTFFPLLYQVAAAELQPSDIAYPIRSIVRKQSNASFRLGTVVSIDLDRKCVIVTDAELTYDYLVVAPGSTTNYFGVEGAAEHSLGLRTLDDGIVLRNRLLRAIEAADVAADESEQERLSTFVVVGGGPTGVEFSGALQEFLNGSYVRDFGRDRRPQVILLEAGDSLLRMYPDRLRRYALEKLRRMGVDVRVATGVEAVTAHKVETSDGSIPSTTVVWTAGVGGSPTYARWGFPSGPTGTVLVTPALNLESHPDVFVVGDIAHNATTPTPLVAQNALQQGRHAARTIENMLNGQEPDEFQYRDLGNMAVIGKNAAVVHLWNRIAIKGFVAWAIWLVVHLSKLIGFRNRLAALISWTGDYFFSDRVARLIIPGHDTTRHE